MNTPIRDFVKTYAESDSVRLHMPGHKGKSFIGCEKYDITEIDGADVLYSARGVIKESEDNASKLFGTYRTFYSAEGSSLCIKAMLAMVLSERKKEGMRPKILAARNVHKAFIHACALLDLDVEWIMPSGNEHFCSCNVTTDNVREVLENAEEMPLAVYVTSPDYLGQMLDIKAISDVCNEFDVPLLVDNAHGAYLHFLKKTMHPIDSGAYMCCDSAHKTLPVLTGGAYLHISEKAKGIADIAENMLSLFSSTSPSYLILQSLDLCNKYLDEDYKNQLQKTVMRIEQLEKELSGAGYKIISSEPLKVVVDALHSGVDTDYAINVLRRNNIEVEFYDNDYIVLMFSCENAENDFKITTEAFLKIERKMSRINCTMPSEAPICKKSLSIRDAVFSKKELVSPDDAVGRICACPTVSCPPAVPTVVSGEIISEKSAELMKRYGVVTVEVVANS